MIQGIKNGNSQSSNGAKKSTCKISPNLNLSEGSSVVEAYSRILAVSGDHGGFMRPCLSRENRSKALNASLSTWLCDRLEGYPAQQAWKSESQCGGDGLPGESFVSSVVMGHLATLSAKSQFSVVGTPLKHLLRSLISFTSDLACLYGDSDKLHASQLMQTLVCLSTDAVCSGISSSVVNALDRVVTAQPSMDASENTANSSGPPLAPSESENGGGSSSSSSSSGDSANTANMSNGAMCSSSWSVAHYMQGRLLVQVQALFKIAANFHGVIDDAVLAGLGVFLCRLLETASGRQSLRNHMHNAPQFCSILLSPMPPKIVPAKEAATKTDLGASGQNLLEKETKTVSIGPDSSISEFNPNTLPKPVIDFLITLFTSAEKKPKDLDLISICNNIWSWVESGALQRWLTSALTSRKNNPSSFADQQYFTRETEAAPVTITPPAPRKKKDRSSRSRAKLMLDNFFAESDMLAISGFGLGSSSNAIPTTKASKVSEASVLDEDDNIDGDVLEEVDDSIVTVEVVSIIPGYEDSWKLLRKMVAYVSSQDSFIAKNQCISLLRSLETVGNSIVDKAASSADPSGACQMLEPITSLLPLLISLAAGAGSQGHLSLFRTTTHWLDQCKKVILSNKPTVSETEISKDSSESSKPQEENQSLLPVHQLLEYLSDVLMAAKASNDGKKESSPAADGNQSANDTTDSEWVEDQNVEDVEEVTSPEDSDEESLCNKLCTYTLTQKEFVTQHWYHCHSCQMEDGMGVCTICAKVCHKGHDVTYAKHGSFFCDCGAKEDGSCIALVKRNPTYDSCRGGGSGSAKGAGIGFGIGSITGAVTLKCKKVSSSTSAPVTDPLREHVTKRRKALSKQMEGLSDSLISSQLDVARSVLDLLHSFLPRLEHDCRERSTVTSVNTSRKALQLFHSSSKTLENSDQPMFSTVGSQEGAFENTRLNFFGEQGQLIRQLMATHAVRRVAMCLLASPNNRRQHLAVSHEKGKITLLQLSSLLRQQDGTASVAPASTASSGAPKKKVAIAKLASVPVPFTVLSINGNPVNDDYLAVCGLKDCHVIVFTSSGSVSEHLVMHPHLESGSYIIKSLWLPGEQTQLAIVTVDFVKIFDLSVDSLSPQYNLLLPSGKIKDACFATLQVGVLQLLQIRNPFFFLLFFFG